MSRFRKSTIKDVAEHAGVSTTTVSYVVSGRRNVCSPETEKRIRAAVDFLHYTPSSLVSGMQTSIRFAIGACITSPVDPGVQFGNFFFHRMWHGLCVEADAVNYSLLRYPISARDGQSCDPFLDGRVDGVLFHAHSNVNSRPAKIAAAGMPIVLLTRSQNIPPGCATVYVDETEVIEVVLERLRALGHVRIAHIAGPVAPAADGSGTETVDDVAIARLEAYCAWMTRYGLERWIRVHATSSWDTVDVMPILKIWSEMAGPPTAILCANDAVAFAALNAAQALGLEVPKALSIAGIDNVDERSESGISLSTVDVPITNLARESVRCLLRLMSGEPASENRVAIRGATYIERGSTGPASA